MSTLAATLPDTLRLGAVHLTVTDLDRSVDFYERAIGLQLGRRDGAGAALGAGGEELLMLVEESGARRAGRHAGLYHFALLHPSRLELARAAQRLIATGTAISGASDHGVSEAIYLPDPDGNGIELAADRPRERWGDLGDPTAASGPEPLDLAGLPGASRGRRGPGAGVGRARGRPPAPARGRRRARARLLPRPDRLRCDDPLPERRVRVGRRLPPPSRAEHLARRGSAARPGGDGRAAALDGGVGALRRGDRRERAAGRRRRGALVRRRAARGARSVEHGDRVPLGARLRTSAGRSRREPSTRRPHRAVAGEAGEPALPASVGDRGAAAAPGDQGQRAPALCSSSDFVGMRHDEPAGVVNRRDRLGHVLVEPGTEDSEDGADLVHQEPRLCPEDRNGTRNHDEIRFWADYVTPGAGRYIYDDRGRRGGLRRGTHFVIAGDNNADPFDGDSTEDAILQLLDNPRIDTSVTPTSPGGPEQAALQGGANATHEGDPAFDTADFADGAPGNLRADYVLPDRGLRIGEASVFWPLAADPLFRLVGQFDPALLPDGNGFPSSDHRLVAVDVELPRGGR